MNPLSLARHAALAVRLLILRSKRPCLLGLVITDRCNLDCFYCQSKNAGRVHLTFDDACRVLADAYARGHRMLYLTGGEPMIWRDGRHCLADVVALAKRLGFLSVFIYTNGTQPLDIRDCSYIVTVDGPRSVHNALRGGSYDLVMKNVAHAATRSVVASITLGKANAGYLNEYVREITSLGLFRGISFNLLTHWPEIVEQHGLAGESRRQVLDELWRLKRSGYPIQLSRAAYRALREGRWKRPLSQVEMSIGSRLFTCCRDVGNSAICDNCGYSGCAELAQVLAGCPSAIWEAVRML